jgi:hypothetical protein
VPKVIFYVCFTGKERRPFNQMWFDFRGKIFKDYTLKSLKNQTDNNFSLWVSFRPEEEGNPTTKKIEKEIKKSGIEYVLTFNGMMLYDDKHILNHNETLIGRMEKSLPLLKPIIGDGDYAYEVNFDSDDMVHRDFVKLIKSKTFKNRGALYMRDGFCYEISGRIAKWHYPQSQQNYTIMYPTEIYLDARKRMEYQNGLQTHEQIPELFDAEELPKGMFCAVIHGTNISTVWGHPFQQEEIFYEDIKKEIKKDFGINYE